MSRHIFPVSGSLFVEKAISLTPDAMRFLPLALLSTVASVASVRRVLVTGANKGIGLQIVKKIVQTVPDAHLLLGSRDKARGEKAVQDVIALDPTAAGRVELLELDVTSDDSVAAAAAAVRAKYPDDAHPLFGLCNNAGVGVTQAGASALSTRTTPRHSPHAASLTLDRPCPTHLTGPASERVCGQFGKSIPETLETNFYGTKRCCEAFVPLLSPAGRICNVASASGPNFVRGLDEAGKQLFTSRLTTWAELEAELNRYAAGTDYEGVAYGLSKAAVNQWTMQLAAAHPELKVNSCSPGYILTDLTKGMGATKRPEESNCHVAPLFLLFGDVPLPPTNQGRYYGSDAVRSPIDVYRGPGDPPYEGD